MPNHHALVYIADSLAAISLPEAFRVPSTDVAHIVVDRLRIDDARQLITDALMKPVEETHRTFVIAAREVQPEAQHALLKLFEEPPLTTRFILVVPRFDMLLPTLRSRVLLVGVGVSGGADDTHFATFLKLSYAERLALVADMAKDKDTEAMEAIVRGAEVYAATNPSKEAALLAAILRIRDYFSFPGASRKMLIESLALALPVV